MTERKFIDISEYTDKEIINAIKNDDLDVLIEVCISLGFNHESWKFTQDICLKLSDHKNPLVRGNALYGLAHTARVKQKLEKNIVKPILLRARKDLDETVRMKAEDSREMINQYMNWNIGEAKIKKGKH